MEYENVISTLFDKKFNNITDKYTLANDDCSITICKKDGFYEVSVQVLKEKESEEGGVAVKRSRLDSLVLHVMFDRSEDFFQKEGLGDKIVRETLQDTSKSEGTYTTGSISE